MGVLNGKSIVITGAGRGIGSALAISAASEGARVVVNDVQEALAIEVAREICDSGGIAIAHPCDVSVRAEAERLIDHCCDEFGSINGLVNNAAVIRHHAIDEITDEDIQVLIGVNLIGTVNCGRRAIHHMRAKGGVMVNVTSGSQMGQAGVSIYSATKGAVASLTYSWAIDLEGSGIRVNAISPFAESHMSHATDEFLGRRQPRPQAMPAPSANAPLVNFLLSDMSQGLNGQVIRIAGEQMNVVTHPALLHPALYNSNWTAHAINQAFKQEWQGVVQSLGYQTVQQRPAPLC